MTNAVPRAGTIRRVTIQIEGDTGCNECLGSGEVLSGQLDAAGKWFSQQPCENCNGTGDAKCAAVGCTGDARCVVSLGAGPALSCCGDQRHTRELVQRLLDGWL